MKIRRQIEEIERRRRRLPSARAPNGRGVAEAWAAAADADETEPNPIGLLIVSGDEAAADPSVRALAELADS